MSNKVLYIEYDPENMALVKRALESRGFVFFGAQNGMKGLEIAEMEELDVILLNLVLPDINGFEVARRLRKSGKSNLIYVPIIAITANPLRGDAEKALAAGCDVYMAEPIHIRELWARVEMFIEQDLMN